MNTYSSEERMTIYSSILNEELQMALGCTEPIAIAYCAAYVTDLLGGLADHYDVYCSGNIIKNVKAVTVPQTGGLTGIEAAVLIGAIGGDSRLGMEVLSPVTEEDRVQLRALLQKKIVNVELLKTYHALHIVIEAQRGNDTVSVEIVDGHTQLGTVKKNGEILQMVEPSVVDESHAQRQALNVKDIISYADTVDLASVSEALDRQITCNLKISEEGLSHIWGAAVGQSLMGRDVDLYTRLAAAAAAGSDARMNGCAMPVVINSGSGNQGLTIAVPMALYAKEKGYNHETLLRGLCVANLIAIHQKTTIGKLSAFCGAVSAAAGCVCGIAYMDGADFEVISQTLINCVASIGGMVCDGAKSSCAGKIACALQAAFMSYDLAKLHRGYKNGEGIVQEDVEETIQTIGRVASKGMHTTDEEILNIMIGK